MLIFIDFDLRGHGGIVDASLFRFNFLCGSRKGVEIGQIVQSLFGIIEKSVEVGDGVEEAHGALL